MPNTYEIPGLLYVTHAPNGVRTYVGIRPGERVKLPNGRRMRPRSTKDMDSLGNWTTGDALPPEEKQAIQQEIGRVPNAVKVIPLQTPRLNRFFGERYEIVAYQ